MEIKKSPPKGKAPTKDSRTTQELQILKRKVSDGLDALLQKYGEKDMRGRRPSSTGTPG